MDILVFNKMHIVALQLNVLAFKQEIPELILEIIEMKQLNPSV